MEFHELKLIVPNGIDSESISDAVKEATTETEHTQQVISSTVHARWPEKPINRNVEATVLVAVNDADSLYPLIGVLAREMGLVTANHREVGDDTLNFKGSDETVEEFMQQYGEMFK